MTHLLYYGDSPTVATGFGNVGKQLLDSLIKKDPTLDITVIGINDRGAWKDPEQYKYKIYPAIYDNYHDLFGIKRFVGALTKNDPEIEPQNYDVLFVNYDCFFLHEAKFMNGTLAEYIRDNAGGIKHRVIYTPIDNHMMKKEWIEALKMFHEVIVPSFYGKRVIESYDKDLGRRTKVVYYSVDTEIFKPLGSAEKELRRKEYGKAVNVDLSSKYIVGYVGRNQWRKDLYRLIKIFSLFKKEHPEAYLYIHTRPDDTTGDGGNLLDLLAYFDLYAGRDYLFPFNLNQNKGVSAGQLNEFYNLMDVFLSCSVGEGFGLPYVEAMATGIPVIAPNNTTVPELFNIDKTDLDLKKQVKGGRGFIYKNSTTHCFGYFDYMRERELGDIDDALATLEFVYQNRGKLDDMQTKARKFAESLTAKKMTEEIYDIIKM